MVHFDRDSFHWMDNALRAKAGPLKKCDASFALFRQGLEVHVSFGAAQEQPQHLRSTVTSDPEYFAHGIEFGHAA